MDRFALRCRCAYLAAVVMCLGAVLPVGGCRSALATALYLIKGTDVDAEFDGLKEKKVVVAVRPLVGLQYRNAGAARDLAQQISRLLAERVPKIQVVDSQKVAAWMDENQWEDYPEIAEALQADLVVGVDLEQFSIYQGQTLYQGKADASVRVYDQTQQGKVVFEKILPQALYPPSTGIPASEKPEAEFRREFIRVLADQIGRHFYAHDRGADFARDAAALR